MNFLQKMKGVSDKRRKKIVSRPVLILWPALCLLLTGLMAAGVFEGIDWKLLDAAFQKRKPIEKRRDIITIEIDDSAINSVGRWPWSWEKHSALLDFLSPYKPRAVTFMDMDFSREIPISFPEGKERAYSDIFLRNAEKAGAAHSPLSLLPDPNRDFYDGLKHGPPACFSFVFKVPDKNESQKVTARAGTNIAMQGNEKKEAVRRLREKIGLPGGPELFPAAADILPPVPNILENAACYGFNTIVPDKDGVVRRLPLITYYNGSLYPSVTLRLAGLLLSSPEIKMGKGNNIELRGAKGSLLVPVNARGEMSVNWTEDYKNSFVHLPFNLVSRFVGYQIAKAEARKYPLESLPDPMALNNILVGKISGTNFFADEMSTMIGTSIFVATLFEHYATKERIGLKEAIAAIGGDGNEDLSNIGREVYFNNFLATRHRGTGTLPSAAEALKALGTPISEELKKELETSYALTAYHIVNGTIDRVRPLYFGPAGELKQGAHIVSVTPLIFRDAAVFYGLTATGLAAQNATPFGDRENMLDLAPNALNTMLTGNFLREPPSAASYVCVYGYLLIVLLCAMLLSPGFSFVFAAAAVSLHVGLAWFSFQGKGYVLPVFAPVSAIVLSYLTAVAYRYFQEQRERKKVRSMFSTMVSPEVLKMMEERPGGLGFAGERKEATLFSSDVSGFTTISEGVTARELANILNIYLTPMSNIIMSYNGYIDKYEGDAIKADFGVPLSDPDHGWKACFSALFQQEELKVIQRMILLKYGVKITARMGINTGIVSAGNMGSEKRMQYTVMGEAVTLAEELEPANKLFDTWIAFGPATYEQAKEYVEVRYLGKTELGGHSIPVYELLGWRKEKFMEFWSGRPIPELALESLKRMLPEKVQAYGEFYENKGLPDSALVSDFKKLFSDLRDPAFEYMRVNNAKSILMIRSDLEDLGRELSKHEHLFSGDQFPPHFLNDTAELQRRIEAEPEEWNRVLLTWRRELRECGARQFLLRGKIEKEDSDRFLNLIDVLEKSVECVYKRITFATVDDLIGREMSSHLKDLIMDKTGIQEASSAGVLTEKSAALENEINSRLSLFVEALKERPLEYHAVMSDFCTVHEEKRLMIALYGEGYELFARREWDAAAEKLREALRIAPDDGPSIQLMKKIEEFKKNPPADTWNGEW